MDLERVKPGPSTYQWLNTPTRSSRAFLPLVVCIAGGHPGNKEQQVKCMHWHVSEHVALTL